MITLNNILKEVKFELVWKGFVNFYPDLAHLKDKYLKIFNLLLLKIPNENVDEMIIHIDKQEIAENTNEIEFRVHGKEKTDEWTEYYDISSCKWGDWIGFYLYDKVFEHLSNEEIVALCLYEMTWFGITEDEVINSINNLDKNCE